MRLYQALLCLYPASFRDEYGPEMAAIFRQRLRNADGALARGAIWIETFLDIVMNAAAMQWDILTQDVRYTARTLRRSPVFALTAIVIVALGVGANTAAFSITDFVLFRPLPLHDVDRLVTVSERAPGYPRLELSPANYRDWKQAATSFERMGVYTTASANLVGAGEPERLVGAAVSADLFPTLGVHAALGRIFNEGEDNEGAPRTLILSDPLWRTLFAADPGVVGRKVLLSDRPYTIIGVMPRDFSFPSRTAEYWEPLEWSPGLFADRNNNHLYAIGRLKPGATLESARTEMTLLAARSQRQYPKENENIGATVNSFREELSRQSRVTVLALSGAALCVLLIVCANLANLLLARALGRRQELAVRAAMGAGRERLIRQLATESIVLATLGGTTGVVLAVVLVPILWRMVPAAFPSSAAPAIDLRVLAFAAVLTFVTALTFGLVPMLRTGADADARGLREGTRATGGRKEQLRGALVIAEVGASVVLLIVTGLLVRALWNIRATDPGFRPEGVLTVMTELPWIKYGEVATRTQFYSEVLGQVRALPGVSNTAYITGLPMVRRGGIWPVGIRGSENERADNDTASLRYVTPGFFSTMNVPLRAGRDVRDTDTINTQFVAVVSESFVKRHWPGQDPLGRQFNFAFKDRTIVGVVGDVRIRGLERDSEPQVYLPYRQVDDGWLLVYSPSALVLRASTPLAPLVPSVRAIIRAADPQQPISDVRPMVDIIDAETASRAVQVRVLAGFALLAFLLAAIGIHGVLSFAVSQRTPEIGVRIALGARRRDILSMVMKHGTLLVAAGLVPGLALAYVAGRSLQTLLNGVSPLDGPTFGAVIGLTLLMAVAGTLLPTLRALRIDPITAIRAE